MAGGQPGCLAAQLQSNISSPGDLFTGEADSSVQPPAFVIMGRRHQHPYIRLLTRTSADSHCRGCVAAVQQLKSLYASVFACTTIRVFTQAARV